MAIKQLTDEQVRTWTIEQKDRWWLENVYRGDMPQLTVRSALTGMVLGGVLSLTNLYLGIKTGWTLGVGITSVILAFAAFKVLSSLKLADEFTILENNCMQSIASAAGYMAQPLTASLAAYMMITREVIPSGTIIVWLIPICTLGVLFAFPLKRRFINDEQHPFPEGRAAGVVLDALHTSDAAEGLFKAKLLVVCGLGSAVMEFLKEGDLLGRMHLAALKLPGAMEAWLYRLMEWKPAILGTRLEELTVSVAPDHVMAATGGLMGIRAGMSLMVGAVFNYCVLAPLMIRYGDIHGTAGSDGALHYGFTPITKWALWGGVALMTTSSIFSFLSKPGQIVRAFSGMFGGRGRGDDCLKHIELPMSVFVVGIPVVGAVVVYLGHRFFGVNVWLGMLAVPLVFLFSIIGAHSTALTSITPTGALGKLTQLTYAALTDSIRTNVATASITAEVAGNSSNLLMDIKPGYMLGGKPRQQAVGHVLGILAGSLVCVPVFSYVFVRGNPGGLVTDENPFPSAIVWKAVAEILTQGLSALPRSAVAAMVAGATLGILLEVIKLASRNRFPLSAVGIGLATVVPFPTCLAMFLGSFVFWLAGAAFRREGSWSKRVFVDNLEPICAGVIAGGALMGIAARVIEVALEAK